MNIFSKKEEIEDDFEEEAEERLFEKKRFRDLNPQNKKRRKELPKPWGKKERSWVFAVFAVTILASTILAITARDWKLPGFPKISLPNLDLFKEGTIIVGNNKNITKEKFLKSAEIISSFKKETENLSGTYAFYLVDLENKTNFGLNQKEIMQAASLIKLPVLATLYQEAEAGRIDLDSKYVLKEADKISGSGSLQSKPAGTVLTYRQLASLMGKQSDNTAFGIIKTKIGKEKIGRVIAEIGMNKTSLEDNLTTPEDIGIFFTQLWEGKIVSLKSRDEILKFLTDTIYENWLVKGIPEVKIAHKYGRELHVINDAGIVFAEKPFVLVIMTKGIVEKDADAKIPELAKMIYQIQTAN